MKEWRHINGFPYEVSDMGEVRRIGVTKPLKPANNKSNGYLQVVLYHEGKPHARKVHLLVAAAFHGPKPLGLEVNHDDGRKHNNTSSNLAYCTGAQNKRHAVEHGLTCRGSRAPKAKLTEEQAIELKRLYRTGIKQVELARQFGLSRGAVNVLVRGITWRHLD